jgi:hypothetical protein
MLAAAVAVELVQKALVAQVAVVLLMKAAALRELQTQVVVGVLRVAYL